MQPLAHQGLIFADQQANGPLLVVIASWRHWHGPPIPLDLYGAYASEAGNRTSTRVPWPSVPALMVNAPPAPVVRSRMPVMPKWPGGLMIASRRASPAALAWAS